jgi:adenosylhomocysteine nucleosidase
MSNNKVLAVKTGLWKIIVSAAHDVVKLSSGQVYTLEELEEHVPANVGGILSIGICGGLAPSIPNGNSLVVGQTVICDNLITPEGSIIPDREWGQRIVEKTKAYKCNWWSSGVFSNTNTPEGKQDLYKKTGCQVVDVDTYWIGKFSQKHNIPFQALRVISDSSSDTLPDLARDSLNNDGTLNLLGFFDILNPLQLPILMKTLANFVVATNILSRAAEDCGPHFQWK